MHSRLLSAFSLTTLLSSLALVACGDSGPKAPPGEPAPGRTTPARLVRAQSCGDLESLLKEDAAKKLDAGIDEQIKFITEYGGYYGYAGGYGRDADGGPIFESPASGGGAGGGPAPAPNQGGEVAEPGDNDDGGSVGGEAPGYSDTNTQVKGVDEADFVETDGANVYLLHGSKFLTLGAEPAAPSVAQQIDIEGSPREMFVARGAAQGPRRAVIYSEVNGAEVYAAAGVKPKTQYVDYGCTGDVGVGVGGGVRRPAAGPALGLADVSEDEPFTYAPLTKVTVLDLEGAQPAVVSEVYFEGQYATARRVDSTVRTVLNGGHHGPELSYFPAFDGLNAPPAPSDVAAWVQAFERVRAEGHAKIAASTASDWLPYYFVKAGGAVTAQNLACEGYHVPDAGSSEYGLTQVQSFDVGSPTQLQGTAVVGRADVVYSNADSLYVAAHGWNPAPPPRAAFSPPAEPRPGTGWGDDDDDDGSAGGGTAGGPTTPPAPVTLNFTHLHKFDLSADPTRPLYVASGTVAGSVHNQFSLDEHQGNLRVATNENRTTVDVWSTQQFNHLYVLAEGSDGVLAKVGDAGEFAPDERITSARFVGTKGYLVTFRQTDPLFVFDLSDPAAPTLLGELKIPGFSEYMHPIDDGHLLTIGQDGDEVSSNGKLALQIFDVTDPVRPRQSHKFTFSADQYGYSAAQHDHKAFTYFADKKLLAFPYVSNTFSPEGYHQTTSRLEVFRVDVNAGFNRVGAVDHSDFFPPQPPCGYYAFSPEVRRGLFIGDNVYSISYGGLRVNNVNDLGQELGRLDLFPLLTPPGSPFPAGGDFGCYPGEPRPEPAPLPAPEPRPDPANGLAALVD